MPALVIIYFDKPIRNPRIEYRSAWIKFRKYLSAAEANLGWLKLRAQKKIGAPPSAM